MRKWLASFMTDAMVVDICSSFLYFLVLLELFVYNCFPCNRGRYINFFGGLLWWNLVVKKAQVIIFEYTKLVELKVLQITWECHLLDYVISWCNPKSSAGLSWWRALTNNESNEQLKARGRRSSYPIIISPYLQNFP